MIYTFLNTNTNEIEEHTMRLSEYDSFKENNPHLQRHFSSDSIPGLGDGMNTIKAGHKTKMQREW